MPWVTIVLVLLVLVLYFQLQSVKSELAKVKSDMKTCCDRVDHLYSWADYLVELLILQFAKCGCPQDPRWPPEGPGDWPGA